MNAVHAVMLLVIASIAYADRNPSLATVLTPDGRIMEGASGSFDPEGFCMNYGPEGEPLFEEDPVSPWEPVFWPDGQDPEGAWYTLGSGVNYYVYTIDISDTGILYAGGTFTSAGGVPAKFIALWDGSSWHPLGSGVGGVEYPDVYAIAVSGSDVYVAGWFTEAGGSPANNIARWDGSSWHSLGIDVEEEYVLALAVSGPDVYVGGVFTQAGGSPASGIARWDGSSWHPLGSGVVGGGGQYPSVSAIAVSGPDVYVGGHFTEAGGSPANYIARWDGSSWHPLGSGVGGDQVNAIAVSGPDVYVGGHFTEAGGSPANYIARWEPNTGIGTTPEEIPVSPHAFLHASPNPTSTGTELSFQSIRLSPFTLEIYDTAGRLVRTEDLGTLPAGSHAHYWNGQGGNGQALAQGVVLREALQRCARGFNPGGAAEVGGRQ